LACLLAALTSIGGFAQNAPLVPIGEKFQITSANERSTLDRQTRILTSSADVTLKNISEAPIAGPLHAVIGLHGQDLQAIQAPGALGGLGQSPYQTFYFDLGAQLTSGVLPAGGAATFHAVFMRPSTVSFSYDVMPYAAAAQGDQTPP
jgi:hypothetical protein